MDYVYIFSDYNFSYHAHYHKEAKERILANEWNQWKVVYFHTIAYITYSNSFLIIHIRKNHNFMPSFNQTLSQLIHVHFYTS